MMSQVIFRIQKGQTHLEHHELELNLITEQILFRADLSLQWFKTRHLGTGGRICGSDAVAEKTGFKDVIDTRRIISSFSHFCLSFYILSIKHPIHIYLENMIFKVPYLGCRK